jgi:hypothetical protein
MPSPLEIAKANADTSRAAAIARMRQHFPSIVPIVDHVREIFGADCMLTYAVEGENVARQSVGEGVKWSGTGRELVVKRSRPGSQSA